jgi:Kef-type K+ transport system membrane component KefB
MSFVGLVIVCAVAFGAPLLLGFFPRVRLPPIVLEILAGIVIGPAGLKWVVVDQPIRVLSTIGLAFLLFLAGLELDIKLLRGRRLGVSVLGFAVSVVIGMAIGYGLHLLGMVESVVLIAICLSAGAVGMVAPVLKDAGEGATDFGQLVIAAVSISDFGVVLLLSLLFSRESSGVTTKLLLIGGFVAMIAVLVGALLAAERSRGLEKTLTRLQDTTSQIRIRGAFLLMVALTALAVRLGLEVILGAFVAGTLISVLDRDYARTHPKFHEKLEAIGFGVFVPVFFVTSGLQFDLGALFADRNTLIRVPIFLVALLLARGLPALLYRSILDPLRLVVAALLQATSLPFIVATTTIGLDVNAITRPNASALVAAGLLSVVIFPATALALLRRTHPAPAVALAATD